MRDAPVHRVEKRGRIGEGEQAPHGRERPARLSLRRPLGLELSLALLLTACGGHVVQSHDPEAAGGAPAAGGSANEHSSGGSGGQPGTPQDCTDCDGDHIDDHVEVECGLDPLDLDTDDDGIADGDEDIDGDCVVDPGETDPRTPDSDGDGICDAWPSDIDGDGESASECTAGEVLFVDCTRDADGGDGHSWETAFGAPNAAITAAHSGQQLWIRRGTCLPTQAAEPVLDIGYKDLSVYGGFLGSEVSLAARPLPAGGTTLDGDWLSDDGGASEGDSFPTRVDDSSHVVRINPGARVVLDGLELRHGYSLTDPFNQDGAGILADGVTSLALSDVHCSDGVAAHGGCLFVNGGQLTARRVSFAGNRGMTSGGAAALWKVGLDVAELSATNNEAPYGGALSVRAATGSLRSSHLDSNVAMMEGGALLVDGGTLVVERTSFHGNRGPWGGAALVRDGQLSLDAVTLIANEAFGTGGAIRAENGTVELSRAALVGNVSGGPGGALHADHSAALLTGVSCVGNSSPWGGCLWTDGPLTIRSTEVRSNHASEHAGGIGCAGPSAVLVNVSIVGNSSDGDTAAALFSTGEVQLTQLSIVDNTAQSLVDGVLGVFDVALRLDNSLVWQSDAGPVAGLGLGELVGEGNCAQTCLTSPCSGTTIASLPPLTCGASAGDCPQSADSPCVDVGSNVRAQAVGFSKQGLTTTRLGPDLGTVDAGYHFAEREVAIDGFEADASRVFFHVVHAKACTLFVAHEGEVNESELEASSITGGSASHGAFSGDSLYLVCRDESARPKSAAAVVP